MSSKIFYCTKVVAYGILCIITKLEFFQHHFFETGHRNTSCDPHLHPSLQATNACTASREASAAGVLRPNAGIGKVGSGTEQEEKRKKSVLAYICLFYWFRNLISMQE